VVSSSQPFNDSGESTDVGLRQGTGIIGDQKTTGSTRKLSQYREPGVNMHFMQGKCDGGNIELSVCDKRQRPGVSFEKRELMFRDMENTPPGAFCHLRVVIDSHNPMGFVSQ